MKKMTKRKTVESVVYFKIGLIIGFIICSGMVLYFEVRFTSRPTIPNESAKGYFAISSSTLYDGMAVTISFHYLVYNNNFTLYYPGGSLVLFNGIEKATININQESYRRFDFIELYLRNTILDWLTIQILQVEG